LRVIIAGSRDITDPRVVEAAIQASGFRITEVINGTARGVDTLDDEWARRKGKTLSRFPADWKRHGQAAGPIRNEEMARYAASDVTIPGALIAIWDGESPGTKNMIDCAQRHGLRVYIHRVIP